jgi:hypothetical protein
MMDDYTYGHDPPKTTRGQSVTWRFSRFGYSQHVEVEVVVVLSHSISGSFLQTPVID